MTRYAVRILSLALVALVVAASLGSPAAAPASAASMRAPSAEQASGLGRALQATVYLYAPVDADPNSIYVGAGTILSPDGYIVTYHGVLFDENNKPYNQAKQVAVGLNDPQDPTALPTMAYWARLVSSDPDLGIAIFKISSPYQSGTSLPADLGLVPMVLGDSNSVRAGDPISVLGYGSSTTQTPVGATRGTILGQSGSGNSSFLTTDVTVAYGNHGGPVLNAQGQMIGIAQGVVNPSPGVGGTVVPINQALPLMQSANVQVTQGGTIPGGITSGNGIPGAQAPGGSGPAATPPAGLPVTGSASQASITNLLFSDVIDMNGQPGTPTTSFSAGTRTVFATFDYSGFQNGQTFSYTTLRPGNNRATENLTWSNGPQGHSFVNLNDENGLAEGSYVLTLALAGVQLATGTFTVGGSNGGAQGGPQGGGTASVGPIAFAEDRSQDDQPIRPHGPGQPFSAQTTQIYAFFGYLNVPAGPNNADAWYRDGTQIAYNTWAPEGGSGTWYSEISTDDGSPMIPGHYVFEVDLPGGQVAGRGEFDLGNGNGGPGTLASNTGVQVVGTVTDADTGQPIADVTVGSLNPGINPSTFIASPTDSMLFSTGQTDSQGRFTLTPPWAPGNSYYVVAGKTGYEPVWSPQPYNVGPNTETPFEVTIQLHQSQQ